MKTLQIISIVLGIMLISSCNKEEPKPQIKSLIGNWEFTSNSSSGNFTISNITNVNKITAGSFTVNGITYTVNTSTTTNVSLVLQSSDVSMILLDYQVDTDYNTITAQSFSFNKPGSNKVHFETVICTRK